MKKAGVEVLWGDEWQIEGDLVLKERKMYVMKGETLRVKIIQLHHDVPVVGYKERWKTTEFLIRNYWWPGVMRDVGKYVNSCDMY